MSALFVNLVSTKTCLLKTKTYTETELIQLLLVHDEAAYRYLYDNYSKALFTIIYQVVNEQGEAEDILQQVFLKIWKNISQYDAGKGRLFTWLLNIARNLAIDFTRSKQFNKLGKTVSLTENVYTDERTVSSKARDTGLKKILDTLPEEQRKLLELSYFSGYSHQEIATMLALPLGTVKTRLRTIILELRKRIDINNL